MGEDTRQIRQDIDETRGRVGDTVEALGHKTDVGGRAKEAVSDKVDAVRSKVSGATPDGKESAQRAVGIARENPLGLGIGALAAGFIAGLLIPSTRVENEKIGPLADDVKEKVRETGQEAVQRGKRVAEDAAAAAKEAGREQGQGMRESAQAKTNG
jgi:ElaB/YqjD/DUF883 family membrane-anchored ribosome-binding protein